MQRTWVREGLGWLGALAVALIVSGQATSSGRAELIFRDADSLIVTMFGRALLDGTAGDWAMSTVLFLPESFVYAGLDALLPVGIDAMFAVSAVVNLLALYGALRLAAGRRRSGSAPVAWALIGLAVFGMLVATETSSSRNAFELASLLLTTTYYSATVVGVVLTVGLLRRYVEGATGGIVLLAGLAVTAAVSTLTNPLFAVWATGPLSIVLALLASTSRAGGRLRLLVPLLPLLGGTALGFALRIPFAAWITNTGAGYLRPERWAQSLAYYGDLLSDRLSSPLGVLGTLLTLALLVLAVRRSFGARPPAERLVALAAWSMPLLVLVGAIAMGTEAARYLQPLAFAPVLALIARPRALALPRRVARQLTAVVGVLLLVGAALSVPRVSAAVLEPDADLACVTDWVDASDRTGAGQFWTVRLPKLHLDDPRRLVQVDHRLNAYAWLVDRGDFAGARVTFLLEDAQTVGWQLPIAAVPESVVNCGRYRILDFGEGELPLGPAHG